MKFNRRNFLWATFGVGTAISSSHEHVRLKGIRQQRQENLSTDSSVSDSISLIDAAYASEADWEDEMAKRRKLLSANNLTSPLLPYSREMSQRLIHCCKLSVQQYKTNRSNPAYKGDIKLLPAYDDNIKSYTQLANFEQEQDIIENYLKNFQAEQEASDSNNNNSGAVTETIQEVELTFQDKVRQILNRQHRIKIFSGIALTSSQHNVLVFRGTQTQAEWLQNLNAKQVKYDASSDRDYGEVHEGFLGLTEKLEPNPVEVVKQLDPTVPCYITGHSLGAAVATLVAMKIAREVSQLKNQIQLYTFAGPRVGSPKFVKAHSQLIPNSYRIVNLADSVPLVPPVSLGNSYTHIGQKWAFLAQLEDTLLNHVVDTYQMAINQGAEMNQPDLPLQQLSV
ncbi:MAG: lipase family protein [Cyanobacteria bacterium P01_G01_bin.19]